MKILSVEEMNLNLLPLTIEQRIRDMSNGLPQWGSGYKIHPDSGAKTALARFLSSLFMWRPTSEAVIYISEWGVWPSSENFELFDPYRLSKGEARSLSDASVHVFDSADVESFVSILCMILYFVWDAEIFDAEGKCLITISHDEWLEIRTNDISVMEACTWASEHDMLRALAPA
jgi:hypothetical protein